MSDSYLPKFRNNSEFAIEIMQITVISENKDIEKTMKGFVKFIYFDIGILLFTGRPVDQTSCFNLVEKCYRVTFQIKSDKR